MAIGYDSGDTTSASNPNGDDNICIGEITGSQLQGESHTIRIGNGIVGNGQYGYQTRVFVTGISGVTTGGTGVADVVDSNGQLGTTSSSRRFKYDIRDLLNEFQKQHQQIEAQQEKIQSLKVQLEQQHAEMLELRGQMAAFRGTLEKASGVAVANARR